MVQLTKLQIIIGSIAVILVIGLVVGVTVGVVVGRRKPPSITNQQRTIQILEDNPLIDGHNDMAWIIRKNFQNSINDLDLYNTTKHILADNIPSQTDITRLREGHVGGQFWSIYTRCLHQGKDAPTSFFEQIDLMNRIIEKYPDVFQLAKTAEDVRQAFRAKRIASLLGVEGGQAIESSFGLLRIFYQLGVRYMTITHNCNTPWADQNQVDRVNSTLVKNGGLTEFGRDVILEMNRLGMLVDLSHVSKQTMLDVLNVTQSPVIFSHSSAYSLCNHSRNVQDDVLELVKKNGGVVMVALITSFVTCNDTNYGTLADVAAHINHIRRIAGVESVGLGGDYDGGAEMAAGLDDVSKYPKLVEFLLAEANWTEEDIIKLIGGNILRVLEKNEQKAQELQKTMKPNERIIRREELEKFNLTQCRYLDMYSSTVKLE